MPFTATGIPREISIHAPTRGATGYFSLSKQNGYISIHAPTRGATQYTVYLIT